MGEILKIYNYDAETGIYTGEGAAIQNPLLESDFILPAYSTTDKPDSADDGFVSVYDGEKWSTHKDIRGVHFNKKTGEKKTVKLVTESVVGFTTQRPDKFDKWDGDKWDKPARVAELQQMIYGATTTDDAIKIIVDHILEPSAKSLDAIAAIKRSSKDAEDAKIEMDSRYE